MLYRPNFCCQCGEKVARSRWTILTSRRFCDFCEIEQKQHDLLPRAIFIVALLIGASGFTAYVRSGSEVGNRTRSGPRASSPKALSSTQPPLDALNSTQVESKAPSPPRAEAVNGQPQKQPSSSTEPVFFCGAVTRKGTACTRRVKTRTRCWQHAGKPDAPDTALSDGKY